MERLFTLRINKAFSTKTRTLVPAVSDKSKHWLRVYCGDGFKKNSSLWEVQPSNLNKPYWGNKYFGGKLNPTMVCTVPVPFSWKWILKWDTPGTHPWRMNRAKYAYGWGYFAGKLPEVALSNLDQQRKTSVILPEDWENESLKSINQETTYGIIEPSKIPE